MPTLPQTPGQRRDAVIFGRRAARRAPLDAAWAAVGWSATYPHMDAVTRERAQLFGAK
jgi:hypothetical protein